MSDDTPTQRFDAPREPDDVATRKLDQVAPETVPFAAHVPIASLPPEPAPYVAPPMAATPPPRAPGGGSGATPPDRPSRAPLYTVIVIVTLLIVGVAIYLLTLASRDGSPAPVAAPSVSASPTPTPTPTDSPSPTPTPTPTPEPEPVAATFTSFEPTDGSSVNCESEDSATPLEFSWTSENAEFAWIGEATTNAKEDATAQVEPSGSYRDLEFLCDAESQQYTVTLESADGELTSQTVTLVRELAE